MLSRDSSIFLSNGMQPGPDPEEQDHIKAWMKSHGLSSEEKDHGIGAMASTDGKKFSRMDLIQQ